MWNEWALVGDAELSGLGLPKSVPFPTSSGGGGINWDSIINQGFQFGQQFLQSKYAKDAAKSTGYYAPTPAFMPFLQNQPPAGTYNNQGGSQSDNRRDDADEPKGLGGSLKKALDGIGKEFGVSGGTVGLIGLGGVLLLMMNPPKRGR